MTTHLGCDHPGCTRLARKVVGVTDDNNTLHRTHDCCSRHCPRRRTMTAALATDDDPICTARFIQEKLRDPVQDARQDCARLHGHSGRHGNASGDLEWDEGAGISITAILKQADEEKSEQRRRTVADLQEQEAPLDDDGKAKLNMWFLGTIAGMHQKLDALRGTPALDHNVEQAQISLEVASMRLMQVQNILADNLEAQQKEAPSAD